MVFKKFRSGNSNVDDEEGGVRSIKINDRDMSAFIGDSPRFKEWCIFRLLIL